MFDNNFYKKNIIFSSKFPLKYTIYYMYTIHLLCDNVTFLRVQSLFWNVEHMKASI